MNAVARITTVNAHLATIARRVHDLRDQYPAYAKDLDPELFLDSTALEVLERLDRAIDELEGLAKEYNDTRFS